jgi:hypothetical protein
MKSCACSRARGMRGNVVGSWSAGGLFPSLSSRRGNPHGGGQLRVDEVRTSGFQACDSFRFDSQTPPQRVAPTTERAEG